ncbi:hypothetical protein KBC04_03250 [Candidatus Babeliales bacterium]|nr:hypothetical protein [Candidatus Babeliales bacterium]MBP9843932.1 hypothetical protein [Candidatus Babeliales bacterium]
MERFNSFSSDQITLTKRQVSMMMASMLLVCLFIFIVGFFLGKRVVIDDFSSQVTKEALHDQIDFLLTTQSLQSSQDEGVAMIEVEPLDSAIMSDDLELQEIITPALIIQEKTSSMPIITSEPKTLKPSAQASVEPTKEDQAQLIKKDGKQYAQLIGFGTKNAAQTFVARLKKHDVPVILKTVISKTSAGKQRTWYQAITPTYESSQELQTQVSKIKRLEHIRDKDIKIVHIK